MRIGMRRKIGSHLQSAIAVVAAGARVAAIVVAIVKLAISLETTGCRTPRRDGYPVPVTTQGAQRCSLKGGGVIPQR